MIATVLAILMTTAVLGIRSAPVSQVNPARYLTQDESAMIANAVTPDDHRELARYFRQQAERKRQKEEQYLEVSATYRRHPLRIDAVQNVSTADRYLHLADEARDAARADDQMAIFQDQLAEGFVKSK